MKISLTSYRVRMGLLGLLVFLATLITHLPAQLAASWIKNQSSQSLRWQSVTGSIFDASVRGLVFSTGDGRVIFLDRLEFKSSVFSLFTGRIISDVSAQLGQSVLECELVLGIRSWGIDDLKGTLDLKDLSASFPGLEVLGVNGFVELKGDAVRARYGAMPVRGQVAITLSELGLAMVNSSQALGSYQLSIDSMNEDVISGEIETVSADSQVFITGEVRVNGPAQTIDVRGQAWAAMNAGPGARDLLPLLGSMDNGRAQINWHYRL